MPSAYDGLKKPLYSFLIGSLQTLIFRVFLKDEGIFLLLNILGVLAVAEDSKYWNLFYMGGYILGCLLIAVFTGFDDTTILLLVILGIGFLDKLARK